MAEKKRILVIDDHPLLREGLSQLINKQPDLAVCGEAATAAEAKAAVENISPDAVVLDLMLGHSDGLELIKFLKAVAPNVAVLVISMHDENVYAERAIQSGALGYIMKEEAPAKVLEALRTVLGGDRFLSPRMMALMADAEASGGSEWPLTDRELHVFRLIGAGLSTKQIAQRLSLSGKTIETYRENIKVRLGLRDGAELTARARAWIERPPC